jgi:uncharacterized protein (DUF2236 family)
VPPDRATFQVEWDRICEEVLEMNEAVEFVLGLLHAPRFAKVRDLPGVPEWAKPIAQSRVVRRLMATPSRVVAIGGLPRSVRHRFGIQWSTADQLRLDALERAVAAVWPFVPDVMRWQPRALDGWRRARLARAG